MRISISTKIEKTAGFLVQAQDTKNFLWTQRSETVNNPNMWTPITGGHANKGETYLEAAKREFKEETGYLKRLLNVKKLGKVKTADGFYMFFYATVPQEFEIDLTDSSIRKEVQNYAWTNFNSNLSPKHRRFKNQQKSIKKKLQSFNVVL